MARVRIPLTPEDAKTAPREFALVAQLTGTDGTVDAKVQPCHKRTRVGVRACTASAC
jgi:hypothetical protein